MAIKLNRGDVVKFKSVEDCAHHMSRGYGGWAEKMGLIVNKLAGKEITLNRVDSNSGYTEFEGGNHWTWHVGCFELVRTREVEDQLRHTAKTGYRKFKEGDVIIRERRFTDSFQPDEEHTVQRVSSCGYYCWVGGHRHKVPMKYFKLKDVPEVKLDTDLIPDITEDTIPLPALSTFGADECFTKASPDEPVGRVAGDNPHGCGLVSATEKFEPVEPDELLDTGIVAGLVLNGCKVQYRMMGEWLDVDSKRMTIDQIGRFQFRLKPELVNYYGIKLPKPLNVDEHQLSTVYGVSFNNQKTFPCAISTARANKRKGYGQYWATEAEAEKILAALFNPFKEFLV